MDSMVRETKNDEIPIPIQRKTQEWSAVLSAAGLDYHLSRRGGEWVFHIPPDQIEAARREIRAYENSDIDWPPTGSKTIEESEPGHDTWAAYWGVLFLVWFYIWLGPYDPGSASARAGAASATGIVSGEWWRAVTALTLHTGFTHLAGNALSLLLFAHATCKAMGGGLGWLLILASGVAGNMTVAFLSGPFQVSVGASTACFGALGIISSYQSIGALRRSYRWRSIWSRSWLPVCAGLALLGITGAGPGSDLAAHLFGFVFGIIIAVPFGWHRARGFPEWAQRVLEIICITVVMLCWRAAFRSIA